MSNDLRKTSGTNQHRMESYAKMKTQGQPTRRYSSDQRPYERQRHQRNTSGRQIQAECDLMLRNEASLRGKVIDFDNWSLLLEREGKHYLIFKSGIMALIPLEDVNYTPSENFASGRVVAEKQANYGYGYS